MFIASRSNFLALNLVLASVFSSGCSLLDVVNAIDPKDQTVAEHGIVYGPLPRHKLDIYRRQPASSSNAVIVFFYGGGWESGERGDYEFVGHKLAARGYTVVIPDYRVYPQVRFPDFVNDGALAAAYVMDNLPEVRSQDSPVFLMGHSAGAHIVMLIAVDEKYLQVVGRNPRDLSGVIGLAGPYDFWPVESARLAEIFDTPGADKTSQPINYVDEHSPPALLIHGTKDRVVWEENSIEMAAAMENSGAPATLILYPGLGHAEILKPFVPFLRDKHGMLQQIDSFVRDHTPET